MSQLWPHPPYAEDQPHAPLILRTHVLHRGFQTGALLGLCFAPIRHLLSRTPPTTTSTPSFRHQLLRSTGTGALLGVALMAVALPLRMRGREDIEWRDRSWRLLENRGQVEVDAWSGVGAVVGAGAGLVGRGRAGVGGVLGGLGAVGVGSLVGVGGYMVWRHGVQGARWPD